MIGLTLAGLFLASPILGLLGFVRASRLATELAELRARLDRLERRAAGPRTEASVPPAPAVTEPFPFETPSTPSEGSASAPPPTPPPSSAPLLAAPLDPTPAAAASWDVFGQIGPRLLVAGGALAVAVALAFFVKHAWENDWVGPLGRVTVGVVSGLALLGSGLRLPGRDLRPLGQGLCAAGLSTLYISIWAAHALYALVGLGTAGILMLAVTVFGVLLAADRAARLLSLLGWIGAYLTPVLLSTGRDRAEVLFAYLGLLGAGALALERRRRWPETVPVALLASVALYAVWFAEHFRSGRFAVAVIGVLALAALFAFGRSAEAARARSLLAVTLWAGWAIAEAARVPPAPTLLVALLAFLALSAAAREGAALAGWAGVLMAWLSIDAWLDGSLDRGREAEALLLVLVAGGAALAGLLQRGLWRARELEIPDILAHVSVAALLWDGVRRVLEWHRPDLAGAAALALALLYVGLGLAAHRESGTDPSQLRTLFGLAIALVTLAASVGLGRIGATAAWAAFGLLLMALGRPLQSGWLRAAGGVVLGLALIRLPVRHLPLHHVSEPFTPFLNGAFGVWLWVVAAIALAWRLAGESGAGARLARAVLAPLSLVLLFGLLTAETHWAFRQMADVARSLGDAAGVERARFAGGLAISLLWALHAIALLAGGLWRRSRSAILGGYALFALSAAKVVLWDLSALAAGYRIASFLGLGVVLMAAAFLDLRFRRRLDPAPAPELPTVIPSADADVPPSP